MATLLNINSKQLIVLRSQHIFGRHSGGSNTVLDNPEASRLHASILWSGSFWQLQDTSSNGTYINDEPIDTGVKKRLNLHDSIQFGAKNASSWVFINDEAPQSMLVPIKGDSAPVILKDIIVLPSDNCPEISLYQSANGQWLCEGSSGIEKLSTGVKVLTKNKSWYFVNAEHFDVTKKSIQSYVIQVQFNVSQNEEHVNLSIYFDNFQIDLGERIHHYLLLILARKRLEDQQSGLNDSEQGWIDKNYLCKKLGLDENHINILIHRFRKQLIQSRATATQLLQIVERRRGELRFAETRINVIGGNEIE